MADARERVWLEEVGRRAGFRPSTGPQLDAAGVQTAHDLLIALSDPDADDETRQRLGDELQRHHRRREDELAAAHGLPPRPAG